MKKQKVYILGGYQTDFSRNWSKEKKHISTMMREVFKGSLLSTKVDPKDIKAVIIGNFAGELYNNQANLGGFCVDLHPSFSDLPTLRCEAACASSSIAILSAMAHIQAGIYDLIGVLGVEQMKTVDSEKGGDFLGTATWFEREAKGIKLPFPKLFSKLAQAYDKKYGLNKKYLARIAAINYKNAKNNPNAQTRNWFMNFDHANSISKYNSFIDKFIKVSDCSQITDGAACLYLASEDYAAEYAKKRKIKLNLIPYIMGWGHTTTSMELLPRLAGSQKDQYLLPATRKAIVDAFNRAKIKDCWELDVIEAHDCFTITEYILIDHFGLTKPGKSWQAIDNGIIEMGGKLPINPSGGLIGCGHPVGATGARQALDAFKQVTGMAGSYQVKGAKKAAVLNIGGVATTSVCLIIGL